MYFEQGFGFSGSLSATLAVLMRVAGNLGKVLPSWEPLVTDGLYGLLSGLV